MSTFDATKPLTTDNYSTVFVPTLQGNFASLAYMLDPASVSSYGTLSTGMQRFNRTGNGLLEFYNGSAWTASATGYVLKGGDTVAGQITFNNTIALAWKDAGGTARRSMYLSSPNYAVGDIDNAIASSTLALVANASVAIVVNGVTTLSSSSSGIAINKTTLYSASSGEQIRLVNDGGLLSGWNTANSTRTGYLQFNTANSVYLIAENGSTVSIGTAGTIRAVFDTSGQFVMQPSTSYIGHNGTTGVLTVGAAVSLADATARIELYDTVHATAAKQIAYRADTHTWTKAAAGTAYMTLSSAGSLVVGSSLTSNYDFASRGVIQVSGSTAAIFGLSIGGSAAGYLLHDGTTLHVTQSLNSGLTIETNSTARITVTAAGNSIFAGAAATTPVGMTMTATTSTADMRTSNVFTGTLTGNIPAANLSWSNFTDGQTVNFFLTQDATGSRTITWPTSFKWPGGTVPALSTAANAVDLLVLTYRAATGFFYATLAKGFA